MNEQIKQKWVEALRSGEYKQARGHLHIEDVDGRPKFCCLGVLCDLHAIESGNNWNFNSELASRYKRFEFIGETCYPPKKFQSGLNLSQAQ